MNSRKKKFFVTGGAGFIGSALIRHIILETEYEVVNVDKLTYAGNLESLQECSSDSRYSFERIDICDSAEIRRALADYKPDVIMHLAAESHVDRSIEVPLDFVKTNVLGTTVLLSESVDYFRRCSKRKSWDFRFHQISTDEVYGDLVHPDDFDSKDSVKLRFFREDDAYAPSSPYAASKAASDHLVRAWYRTYNLPIIVTNCSNNYGPYQFPEKLIPLMISRALAGQSLPIYGEGTQIRDWLFVEDHVRALVLCVSKGLAGETYNIGGHNEMRNIDVVNTLCDVLDQMKPKFRSYRDQIEFVEDRPGHDKRYAIDAGKIEARLGWKPVETFQSGIKKTVKWYLENTKWTDQVLDGSYRGERLGRRL